MLKLFAYYLIPIGIGLVSIIALLFWHDQYRTVGDVPLTMHVAVEQDAELTPRAALARLRATPLTTGHDTHLSEDPVWFSFEPMPRAGSQVVEFPSRHALDVACWDAASLAPLGNATRGAGTGFIEAAKAGFALKLAPLPAELLCRASFAGPARLSVLQWPLDQYALSVEQYHRKSG
ncbi:MAG: diguanylate cyclase, partial [Telluria sp.]